MESESKQSRLPSQPSLIDALIPIAALIILIGLSIALFGTAATDGPLQVALFLSAAVAALVARKCGLDYPVIYDAVVSGVSTAMGAIFILLAVGALIGTWNLSGTTATVVYYGLKLLQPEFFFPIVALICAVLGIVTGSSWTTAGTLGVAFMGMASVMGVNKEITAGAVISGAYLGDKLTPALRDHNPRPEARRRSRCLQAHPCSALDNAACLHDRSRPLRHPRPGRESR